MLSLVTKAVGRLFHEDFPGNATFRELWSIHAKAIKAQAAPGESNETLQQKTSLRIRQVLHQPEHKALKDKVCSAQHTLLVLCGGGQSAGTDCNRT